jgi:hypothetical protein
MKLAMQQSTKHSTRSGCHPSLHHSKDDSRPHPPSTAPPPFIRAHQGQDLNDVASPPPSFHIPNHTIHTLLSLPLSFCDYGVITSTSHHPNLLSAYPCSNRANKAPLCAKPSKRPCASCETPLMSPRRRWSSSIAGRVIGWCAPRW